MRDGDLAALVDVASLRPAVLGQRLLHKVNHSRFWRCQSKIDYFYRRTKSYFAVIDFSQCFHIDLGGSAVTSSIQKLALTLPLRVLLGGDKHVRVFGPAGTIDRVENKLAGYAWNLLDRYATDLIFTVTDVHESGETDKADFRLRDRFQRGDGERAETASQVVLDDEAFQVRTVALDHGIPCLAFAIQERAHINVWKTGLEEPGLEVGSWLRELKRAVVTGLPDSTPIRAPLRTATEPRAREFALGELKKKLVRVTRGQKIAYVVDTLYSWRNLERIVKLVSHADTLFIEAMFCSDDADRAADRYHLTTEQVGHLARLVNVRDVVPFHFSPRYGGDETRLLREVDETFCGVHQCPAPCT